MKIKLDKRTWLIIGVIVIIILSQSKLKTHKKMYADINEVETDIIKKIGEANYNKIDTQLVERFLEAEVVDRATTYEVIIKTPNKGLVRNVQFSSRYANYVSAQLTKEEILNLAGAVGQIGWNNDDIDLDLYWAVPSNENTPHIMAMNAGQGVKVCVLDSGTHGQHVTGIINSNDINHRGTAPGAEIISMGIGGSVAGSMANIESCMSQGASIISMSWHYNYYYPGTVAIDYAHCDENVFASYLNDIVATQDVIVVASAGNEGYVGAHGPPACASGVVSVGAVTNSHYMARFSSVGDHVDIVAPGYSIYSTVGATYLQKSGTSMSAPFVAGSIATLKSITGTSKDAIMAAIYSTAEQIYGSGPFASGGIMGPELAGAGAINTYQACLQLAGAGICNPYFELNPTRPALPEYGMCSDGILNQDETYDDCGGIYCDICSYGDGSYCVSDDMCNTHTDCCPSIIVEAPEYTQYKQEISKCRTSCTMCTDEADGISLNFDYYHNDCTGYSPLYLWDVEDYTCYSDYVGEFDTYECPSRTCIDGECIPPEDCVDECNQIGDTRCDGLYYNECGNWDIDDCLEWSGLLQCYWGACIEDECVCSSYECTYSPFCQDGDIVGCIISEEGCAHPDIIEVCSAGCEIEYYFNETSGENESMPVCIDAPPTETGGSGGGGGGGGALRRECYYIEDKECKFRRIQSYQQCEATEYESEELCIEALHIFLAQEPELDVDTPEKDTSTTILILIIIGAIILFRKKLFKGR